MKITAPPPIPNRFGSPSGLRVDTWINVPDKPKQPPASKLTPTLGSLISHMTVWITLDLSPPRTSRISITEALLGPVNNPSSAIAREMMTRKEYLVVTPILDI